MYSDLVELLVFVDRKLSIPSSLYNINLIMKNKDQDYAVSKRLWNK